MEVRRTLLTLFILSLVLGMVAGDKDYDECVDECIDDCFGQSMDGSIESCKYCNHACFTIAVAIN